MKWRGPYGGGAASGAAGAQVASRAKSTQYIRARTTPVNPKTVFQQAVRAGVKYLSSAWSALTGTQRTSWQTYGNNVTVTNSLGDASKLSGFNWFVGNNVVRQQAGFAAVLNGPSIFDRGNPNWSAADPIFTTSSGATRGTLTFAAAITSANATNGFLAVYASRPFGPGVNFFNGPYQLAATLVGGATVGTWAFNLPFPASGVGSGDTQNQMQLVLRLDQGDGRLSSKFQVNS